MLLLLLFACPGPPKPDDTDPPVVPPPSLADADLQLRGQSGQAVGGALAVGDVTGDGAPDLIVGAYAAGRACVFEGPLSAGSLSFDDGLCLDGATDHDFAGYAVGVAGDTDGDGLAELLVGGVGDDGGGADAGAAWWVPGPLAPGSLAGAVRIVGEAAGDQAGTAVASAGDTDGDGLDDLLVGAVGSDRGGEGAGAAWLLCGPVTADVALAEADDLVIGRVSPSLLWHGFAGGDAVGAALGGADLDGDGLSDLLIGAPGYDGGDADVGALGIFLGGLTGERILEDADALLFGVAPSGYAGGRFAVGADLSGDGAADLLVGADGEEGGAGRVYLWTAGVPAAAVSLGSAAAVLVGEAPLDEAGFGLTLVPDGDGGGLGVVGAWGSDAGGPDAGRIYVVEAPLSGTVSLGTLPSWVGPAAGEYAGQAVSAGDLSGDGLPDLVAGAPFSAGGGPSAGAVYVLFSPLVTGP